MVPPLNNAPSQSHCIFFNCLTFVQATSSSSPPDPSRPLRVLPTTLNMQTQWCLLSQFVKIPKISILAHSQIFQQKPFNLVQHKTKPDSSQAVTDGKSPADRHLTHFKHQQVPPPPPLPLQLPRWTPPLQKPGPIPHDTKPWPPPSNQAKADMMLTTPLGDRMQHGRTCTAIPTRKICARCAHPGQDEMAIYRGVECWVCALDLDSVGLGEERNLCQPVPVPIDDGEGQNQNQYQFLCRSCQVVAGGAAAVGENARMQEEEEGGGGGGGGKGGGRGEEV